MRGHESDPPVLRPQQLPAQISAKGWRWRKDLRLEAQCECDELLALGALQVGWEVAVDVVGSLHGHWANSGEWGFNDLALR